MSEAAHAADIIVVARVIGIKVDYPTATRTRSHVALQPISMIKGKYSQGTDVFWDEEHVEITIWCDPTHFFHDIQLTETFRYLLYVKTGRIIHAARVTDWPAGFLSTEEELDLVRSQ